MTQYIIQVHCIACGDLHSMGVSVALAGPPTKKQSIAKKFHGQKLPPDIEKLRDARTYCQKFGRHYAQRDEKQIFLVLRE
jgi:hypothetical protein